jgi:hypothetical protein
MILSSGLLVDLHPFFPYVAAMTTVEERRFKGLVKTAVAEVLAERQDLLREAVRESLEDLALLRAIRLGEESPLVSRKKVFRRLERAA